MPQNKTTGQVDALERELENDENALFELVTILSQVQEGERILERARQSEDRVMESLILRWVQGAIDEETLRGDLDSIGAGEYYEHLINLKKMLSEKKLIRLLMDINGKQEELIKKLQNSLGEMKGVDVPALLAPIRRCISLINSVKKSYPQLLKKETLPDKLMELLKNLSLLRKSLIKVHSYEKDLLIGIRNGDAYLRINRHVLDIAEEVAKGYEGLILKIKLLSIKKGGILDDKGYSALHHLLGLELRLREEKKIPESLSLMFEKLDMEGLFANMRTDGYEGFLKKWNATEKLKSVSNILKEIALLKRGMNDRSTSSIYHDERSEKVAKRMVAVVFLLAMLLPLLYVANTLIPHRVNFAKNHALAYEAILSVDSYKPGSIAPEDINMLERNAKFNNKPVKIERGWTGKHSFYRIKTGDRSAELSKRLKGMNPESKNYQKLLARLILAQLHERHYRDAFESLRSFHTSGRTYDSSIDALLLGFKLAAEDIHNEPHPRTMNELRGMADAQYAYALILKQYYLNRVNVQGNLIVTRYEVLTALSKAADTYKYLMRMGDKRSRTASNLREIKTLQFTLRR